MHLSVTRHTVYPKKYARGFVVLCFVVVMQSFIINSHEVFIHIHQGCFAGTGAIVRLPQCRWSNPDGYGKISQCLTTTKHSKAKTVCIFLEIYCTCSNGLVQFTATCYVNPQHLRTKDQRRIREVSVLNQQCEYATFGEVFALITFGLSLFWIMMLHTISIHVHFYSVNVVHRG